MYNRIFGIFATFVAFIMLQSTAFAQQCTTSARSDKTKYCEGETVNLFAASGGTAYSWSGPAGTGFGGSTQNVSIPMAQPNQSGTYWVTMTCANGGTNRSSVLVTINPLPSTQLIGLPKVCEGGTIILKSNEDPTERYLWETPTGSTFFGSILTIPNVTSAYSGAYTVTVTSAAGCTATAGNNVSVKPKPFVSIAQTGNSCAGETITLTASALGATTYSWTGVNNFISNSVDATLSGVSANNNGPYFVSVTDANGCVGSSSTVVSVTTVVGSATNGGKVCEGKTVTLTATGGSNYVWAGPLSFTAGSSTTSVANASPVNSGDYTVTISDANGCSTVATTTVTVNPNPTAAANGTSSSCYNRNNGSVVAVANAGTPPFNYNWSNGINGTIDNISGLSIGDYSVIITDAEGCTASASANVSEPSVLSVEVVQIAPATCAVNSPDGQASTNVLGGTPPYQYLWSNGSMNPNVTNMQCVQGNVVVTDANGCTETKIFNIQCPPRLQFTGDNIADVKCNGGADGDARVTVVGGVEPYAFTWAGQPGVTTNALLGVPAGTYTVDVIDANGCTTTPYTVTIPEPAAAMSIVVSGSDALCRDGATGSATATVDGGTKPYNYLWSPSPATGTSTETALDLPASVVPYAVTATDSRGCSVTGVYTVEEPSYVAVTATTLNTTCYGDDNGTVLADLATGGNGGPYTYSLDNANFQNQLAFQGLPASEYIVYASDQKGCTGSTTVRINQPDPIQLAITTGVNGEISLEMGNSVQLMTATNVSPASLSYIWTKPLNISCLNCPNPIVNPLSPQRYTVQVTDVDGCTAAASVNVDVQKNRNIFIPNIFTPNNDSQNDEFMVYGGLGVKNVKSLKIFDRWGELVFADKDFMPNDRAHSWDGRFQNQTMRPSVFVYVVEVEFVDGITIPYKGDVTLVR